MGYRGILPFLILSILTTACAPASRDEAQKKYGLPAIELHVNDDSFPQIRHGGKNQTPVPARLWYKDRWMQGRVSITGQGTLDHPKTNLQFDLTRAPEGEPESIKISSQAQDPSFLRTLLGHRILKELGLPTPEVDPVALYINGKYSGLYLTIERVNADFYRRRGIRTERIYRAKVWRANFAPGMVDDPESGFEAKGSEFNREEIQRLAIWAQLPPSEARLEEIRTVMDLDSFYRVLGSNIFIKNRDGITNNFSMYKVRGGRLEFSPWDWERAFERVYGAENVRGYLEDSFHRNYLIKRVLDYPELRAEFFVILRDLLTRFPEDRAQAILDADEKLIERAYRDDPYLGGRGRDLREQKELIMMSVREWFPGLTSYLEELESTEATVN